VTTLNDIFASIFTETGCIWTKLGRGKREPTKFSVGSLQGVIGKNAPGKYHHGQYHHGKNHPQKKSPRGKNHPVSGKNTHGM